MLLEACDEDLRKLKERVGKDRRYSTYQRQLRLRKLLGEYLLTLQKEDIPLASLTERFIYDYAAYLSSQRHYLGGTVWLACQYLKGVATRAHQRGLLAQNPFAAFHIGRHIREREYLTANELQSVMTCEISQPTRALCRDLFVLSALTGMSYVDICQLSTDDIRQIDGNLWVFGHRHKTGTSFQVRLLPAAVDIIQHYSRQKRENDKRIFTPICYRTIAKHVPLLMQQCGIDRHVTFHCASHSNFCNPIKINLLDGLQ